MADPRTCCLLGVCCPPGSAAQIQAMADVLREEGYAGNDVAILHRAENILTKLGLTSNPPAWTDPDALKASSGKV